MMTKKSVEREKEKNESAAAKDKADEVKKTDWQEKAQEYLDGWKRSQADFENYKKRQAEDKKYLISYANTDLILQILPVLDNFFASTEHIPENEKENPWVVGIMHIQKQLEQVLTDNGVSEILTKPGDAFDPGIHEAIKDKEDKKEEDFKNIVKRVVQKGYKMGDKVLRPARVTVE